MFLGSRNRTTASKWLNLNYISVCLLTMVLFQLLVVALLGLCDGTSPVMLFRCLFYLDSVWALRLMMNDCKDAKDMGDTKECYAAITWAKTTGIYSNPQWYPGLTRRSKLLDFQARLHKKSRSNCPRPCRVKTTTTGDARRRRTKGCRDAKKHSETYDCWAAVMWAKSEGIALHPSWYPSLTPTSSFRHFQFSLHMKHHGNCPKPCGTNLVIAGSAQSTTSTTIATNTRTIVTPTTLVNESKTDTTIKVLKKMVKPKSRKPKRVKPKANRPRCSRINIKTHVGTFVGHQRSTKVDMMDSRRICKTCVEIEIVPDGMGWVSLRSQFGKYLSARAFGTSLEWRGVRVTPRQKFQMIKRGSINYEFKSALVGNRWITVQEDGMLTLGRRHDVHSIFDVRCSRRFRYFAL